MQKNVAKIADFFATEVLGPPAEVKAGFFLSRTPAENKEELLRAAWVGAGFSERKPIFLKQLHSGIIHTFINGSLPTSLPTGDAVIADSKDVFLIIQVADCLPVLFFDPVKRHIAGAHCGWKGSLLGLAKRTVDKLAELGSNPEDLQIWFGPSIRPCCYEVDVERSVLFPRRDGSEQHIDLVAFNRWLLEEAGVSPKAIYIDPRCTACSSDKLPSYRRDGEKAGRLFAYVALG